MAPHEDDLPFPLEREITLLLEGKEPSERSSKTLPPQYEKRVARARKTIELLREAAGRPDVEQAPRRDLSGETIGDFQILRFIDAGAMGAVYMARQKSLNRVVSLKVLHPHAPFAGNALQRFSREGKLLAKIANPHIISIHVVGNDEKLGAYIVMPYIRGIPLSRVCEFMKEHPDANGEKVLAFVGNVVNAREKGLFPDPLPLPANASGKDPWPRFALRLMGRMAEALDSAHLQKVIHRDIKPSNILLTAEGNPVLVDFGLTRDENREGMTIAGEVLGTPMYLAPECLWSDSRSAGPRSDIYSLGATFYELLTGRPPHQGTSLRDTMRCIEKEETVPARKRNPAVPKDVDKIIGTCLEKRPQDRYQSGEELRRDIDRVLAGQPPSRSKTRLHRAAPVLFILASALLAAIAARHGRPGRTPDVLPSPGLPAPGKDAFTPPVGGKKRAHPSPPEKAEALPRKDEKPPEAGATSDEDLDLERWEENRLRINVEIKPGDPGARERLAEFYRRNGRMEEARTELLAVQRLSPKSKGPGDLYAIPAPPEWAESKDAAKRTQKFVSPDNRGVLALRTFEFSGDASLPEKMDALRKTTRTGIIPLKRENLLVSGRPALREDFLVEHPQMKQKHFFVLIDAGKGHIIFDGYTLESDHPEFLPFFQQALDGLEVFPSKTETVQPPR